MLDPNDANLEESSASSEVQENDTQESLPVESVEATTQEATQKENPPFNEHPRWKELLEEREYYKQQLAALIQKPNQQVVAPVEQDHYAGMSKEEREFYQNIERIAERKASAMLAQKEVAFKQELDQTRQILATVAYERFQSKHPDVVANSPEEAHIAKLYSNGYSLDDAYKVAMFDRLQSQKKAQVAVQKKQTIQNKMAANLETSSISQNSGLPQGKKQNFREMVAEMIDKAST